MFKHFAFFFIFSSILLACGSSKRQVIKSISQKKKTSIKLDEKDEVLFGRLYIDASKEKILGNYDKAAELFSRALKVNPNSAAAHYELGLIYGMQSMEEEAFLEFEKARQLEPDNYWYKISYATFLQSEGRIEESIKLFKELVEENPNQVELKYELSKLLFNLEKYDESIAYLNQIEKEMGVSEEFSFLKQRIYLSQNKVEKAAEEIEKLIESFPDELRYYGVLADIYLSNNQKEKALEVYQKMEAIEPENYLVQFSLAEYHRKEGNQEEYLEYILKAFSNPDMDIDDKVKYFLNFYQIGNDNRAKKEEGLLLCKKIVEAHPENAKSHALYADFLYFNNSDEQAKKEYQKTISLDSSRFPVWNQLLVILSETNDLDGLLNYGERAANLFPNQPSVHFMYGLGLSESKNYRKAIQVLNYAKDLVIDNQSLKSQILSSIADAYHELEEHEKSDQYYEKALQLDPNNVYVLNNYSYYLSLRKEKLNRAKEMSLKSNELAPNQSSFQDTYAWILYQLGEFEKANKWIDKALSIDSSSPVLLEHKGDILYKLGDKEKAVEFWEKAKNAGGDSEELLRKIADQKLYE